MEKVYQVFVSSTYSDLKDERRGVSEFIAKAGFIPSGMELFPASDQQQLEFIKRVIDRCDYYVVIVGARYGTLADDSISFTEKEYEYAITKKIPVLAFLHSNPDTIPLGKTDKDQDKALKLQQFRDRLSKGRMVDYWIDSYELCAKIVIALGQASTLFPGVGWIRGDQSIDPKVLQDMERLRIENSELKKRLLEIDTGELTFPEEIAGPDEIVNIRYCKGTRDPKRAKEIFSVDASLQDIFLRSIDGILRERSEFDIMDHFATSSHPDQSRVDYLQLMAQLEDIRTVRFQLEALGLIRAVSQSNISEGDTYTIIAWAITEKGRRFVAKNLARKRTDHREEGCG